MPAPAPLFLDVLTLPDPLEARRLIQSARRRPDVLGAHLTFGGSALHAPWPSEPDARAPGRDEGWGPGIDFRRIAVIARRPARVRRAAVEEHWRVRLRPVRSRGTLRGRDPFGSLSAHAGSHAEPGVIFTYAYVPPPGLVPFILSLQRAVVEQHAAPGALASLALPSVRRLGFSGFTIGAWRTLGDALRWVNTGPRHGDSMAWLERMRKLSGAGEEWFLRCAVESSEGTLAGRDPFAELAAPAAAAV